MWRKSSFRLRAGSPQRPYVPGWQPARRDVEGVRFVLRASSPGWHPQRPYVPEKLLFSAGWQPARRDVAKEFVSSAGSPQRPYVCRKSSLRLQAGSPHGVMW